MQLNRRVGLRRVARRDVAAVSPGDRWRNDTKSATPKMRKMAGFGKMRVLGDAENAQDGKSWKDDTESATPKSEHDGRNWKGARFGRRRKCASWEKMERCAFSGWQKSDHCTYDKFCWRVQMRNKLLFGLIFVTLMILITGGRQQVLAACANCTAGNHQSCTNMSGWFVYSGNWHMRKCCDYDSSSDSYATSHLAQFGSWHNYNATQHARNCSMCTMSEKENHKYPNGYSFSSTEHWRECSVCGAISGKTAHSDGDGDGYCDTCNYLLDVAPTLKTSPESVTVKSGSAPTFTATADGTNLEYQWYYNTTNSNSGGVEITSTTAGATVTGYSGSTLKLSNIQQEWNGRYVYCVIFNSAGTVTSNTAHITVYSPPNIDSQPSALAVKAGSNGSFTVSASSPNGSTLTYKWYYTTTNSNSSGTAITASNMGATASGMTSATLSLTNIPTSLNGRYVYCEISDGQYTVKTNPALITVYSSPTISSQPTDQAVKMGGSPTFRVGVTGGNPTTYTYQWYYSATNSNSSGIEITNGLTGATPTGQTSATLQLVNIQPSWNNYYVYCEISNGQYTLKTNVAKVTVYSPPTITTQPTALILKQGQDATYTLEATTGNPATNTYKWYYADSIDATGTAITASNTGVTATGYDTTSLKLASITGALNGKYFYCEISNGQYTIKSESVSLVVYSAPNITKQPADTGIKEGSTTTFTVEASGGYPTTYDYQWYISNTNSNTSGTAINSATAGGTFIGYDGAIMTISNSQTSLNGKYIYCEVSNGEYTTKSNVAKITLYSAPTITTNPADVTVRAGANPTFTAAATGGYPTTYTYKWYYTTSSNNNSGTQITATTSGANVTGHDTGTLSLANIQGSWNNTYVYCEISNGQYAVKSEVAKITVYSAPSVGTQPQNITVNTGDSAVFITEGTGGNPSIYTYKWYYTDTNDNNGGTEITATNTGANANGYDEATLILENVKTSLDGKYVYCEISNGEYTVTTNTAKITVTKIAATNPILSNVVVAYDGQPHYIEVSGGDGGTIHYSTSTDDTSWGEWTTDLPYLTDVGTLYVRAYVVGDSEHSDTSPTASKSIKISARTVSNNIVVELAQEAYIYDATAKEPGVTARDSVLGTTLTINTDYTVTYSSNVNAGTASVTVRGTGNYSGTTSKSFLILPALPEITVTEKTVTYSGNPVTSNAAVVTGVTGGTKPSGTITYEYYLDSACTEQTTPINSGAASDKGAPRYAGTYYVKAIIQAAGNYSKATSTAAKITIEKAGPTFTVSPATVNIVKGQSAVVTITYTGDGALSAVSSDETKILAILVDKTITVVAEGDGNATITVSAAASTNYNAGEDQIITVNVYGKPNAPTITVNDGTKNLTSGDWTNTEVTISIGGTSSTGPGDIVYEYSYDGTNWAIYTGEFNYSTVTSEQKVYARAYNENYPDLKSDVTEFILRIDKTKPSAPTYTALHTADNSAYKSGSATNSEVYTRVSTVEATSGIKEMQYSTDGGTTWNTLVFGKSEGITQSGTTYTGEEVWGYVDGKSETIYFRAIDNAGNISDPSIAFIYKYISESRLMTRLDDDGAVYMIGAKRAGLTNYTSEKVTKITLENTIDVPGAAIASWDASRDEDGSVIAYVIADGADKYHLHIGGNGSILASPDGHELFAGYINCTAMNSMTILDTSEMTAMDSMFKNSTNLSTLDTSGLITSAVTKMQNMFENCSRLTTLSVSNFATGNVTNMNAMFKDCTRLTGIDVSGFDTTNVQDMGYMFSGCTSIAKLKLIGFNTSNVSNMEYMFNNCQGLKTLNLYTFDTNKVTKQDNMFSDCINLASVFLGDNFTTIRGENMFSNTGSLEKIIAMRDAAMTTSNGINANAKSILYVLDKTVEAACEANTTHAAVFGATRIKPIIEIIGDNPMHVRLNSVYGPVEDPGVKVAGVSEEAEPSHAVFSEYGLTITETGLPVDTSKEGTELVSYALRVVAQP